MSDNDEGRLERATQWIFGGGAMFLVFDWMWMSADIFLSISGTLFPMLAIASGTLADHIAVFDHPWVHQGLIVVAVAYLIHLGITLVGRIREETND